MRASLVALILLASAARAFPLLEPSAVSAAPLNLTERCVDCTNPNAQPDFSNDVPSCAVCAPQWPSISSCAAASSVFKDASQIMWNPLLFVSVIQCACIDTFRSAYPQCADCFIKTGQCEAFLNVGAEDAPSVVEGIRTTCGFGSVLLGGVGYSSAATASPTAAATRAAATLASAPTTTASGAARRSNHGLERGFAIAASILAVLVKF